MDLDRIGQTARRESTGTAVLGRAALVALLLNAAFWAGILVALLTPPTGLSPQTLQIALGVMAYAVILPLFWSMLLPGSPAGALLQKQTWHLPGKMAVAGGAFFLSYSAATLIYFWWRAQPIVVENGLAASFTVMSLIVGVLVPAIAWCVVTPERWIAELEQLRAVRRIEHAMALEEATMRAAYARAVSLMNADLMNLSMQERRELAGILGAFARVQQQSMHALAASWKDIYGIEAHVNLIPDQQLLEGYENIAGLLESAAGTLDRSAQYAATLALPAQPTAQPLTVHQNAPQPNRTGVLHTPTNATARPATGPLAAQSTGVLHTPIPHEQAYEAARRQLAGAWKRAELEKALSVSKTQASTYIRDWITASVVVAITNPRDHYEWTVQL